MSATISAAIQVPDSEWEWDNEARTRGLATITVNGLPMHLQAIEVTGRDPDGTGCEQMNAADAEYREELDFVYLVGGADSPFATVQIEGRDYVLVATQSC